MFKKFPHREDGQGLVEYALILVLVAIVVIAILLQLGPAIGRVFSQITAVLQAGGTAQQVTINTFNATGTSGLGCSVKVSVLNVTVTKGGQPLAGAAVSGNVTIRGGASSPLSGTTDSSGVAQWNNLNVGTDSGGCGGTATVTIGSASATDGY